MPTQGMLLGAITTDNEVRTLQGMQQEVDARLPSQGYNLLVITAGYSLRPLHPSESFAFFPSTLQRSSNPNMSVP